MTGLAIPQSCGMAGGGKAPAAFFGQLRPDVDLYPGTPQADGSPTWVQDFDFGRHVQRRRQIGRASCRERV